MEGTCEYMSVEGTCEYMSVEGTCEYMSISMVLVSTRVCRWYL